MLFQQTLGQQDKNFQCVPGIATLALQGETITDYTR